MNRKLTCDPSLTLEKSNRVTSDYYDDLLQKLREKRHVRVFLQLFVDFISYRESTKSGDFQFKSKTGDKPKLEISLISLTKIVRSYLIRRGMDGHAVEGVLKQLPAIDTDDDGIVTEPEWESTMDVMVERIHAFLLALNEKNDFYSGNSNDKDEL